MRFQHIRKTGGTTLVAMLQGFFPADGEAAFRHGHDDVLTPATTGDFSFTFVREPFSRLLSERRQWAQAGIENIAAETAANAAAMSDFKTMDMATICAHIFNYPTAVRSFWNHQTLALGLAPYLKQMANTVSPHELAARPLTYFESGVTFQTWLAQHGEGILEAAIHCLRGLDHVGVFETFDVSTRDLFDSLGLPAPQHVPHLNARPAHGDETAQALSSTCAPLLALDHALYAEALQLVRGRAQRSKPARRDYLGRCLQLGDVLVVEAASPFGGHGWHFAHLRQDGRWGRWSERSCSTSITCAKGICEFEVLIFGAVSERALRDLSICIGAVQLATEVGQRDDGMWWVRSRFALSEPALTDIWMTVAEGPPDFGLEVAALLFRCLPLHPLEA